MHTFVLIFIIALSTIGGLIGLAGLIATIRAIIGNIIPAWIPSSVAEYEAQAAKEGWIHRSLVTFDISVNVIVLRGQQDETISTHSYRAFLEGKMWGKLMCDWLNWFQPQHGQKAASGDLYRAQARVAVLQKVLGV